jgi:phosphonoacetaldehyde hydrolase
MKIGASRRGPGKSLQAVVLDWAGTTVDFGCCAPVAVFVEVFRQQGIRLDMAQARGPMGMHKKDHIRAIAQQTEVIAQWREKHETAPSESDVERMYRAFVPLQLDSVANYADPVPGCLDTIAALRERGLRIGSNTGYDREMMDILTAAAAQRGYTADCVVCSSDVPSGRPTPWMALEVARRLDVYPMSTVVKVDDTVPGIHEGLNAGMWTVGVAATGNEVGLAKREFDAMDAPVRQELVDRATQRLLDGGAHYVIDGLGDLLECIDDIERRLAAGETP